MNLLINLFREITKNKQSPTRSTTRLQVESLETRDLMAGTPLASVTDLVTDPFSSAAMGNDNEWRYVSIRRYA